MNGDGFADVAVGSPSDDVFATDGGAARVFAGSSSGLTSTLLWSEGSGTPNARFGSVLTPAGDINADGKGDLLVATTTTISVAQSAGATLVIERNFTLSPTTNCGTAGDVNGDGISQYFGANLQTIC